MLETLWEFTPVVLHHHYWYRKASFQVESNQHDKWVLFAVEDGRFNVELHVAEQAGFGDLVFFPPGVVFRRKVETPLSFHYFELGWDTQQCSDERILPTGKVSVRDTGRLVSTYSHLCALETRTDPPSQLWKTWLLQDLWCLYCAETQIIVSNARDVHDPVIKRAGVYLQQHAHTPLSLGELARSSGLSPVQFTRRFRAVFDTTPSAYLSALRLERAKTLLLETDHTLDDIATRCGYDNGFYLSRVFSKKMHLSPSQFRKTYRV